MARPVQDVASGTDFANKLKKFFGTLGPKEQKAFMELLKHAAPEGVFQPPPRETEMEIAMPFDYMAYGAGFWGGVAGHLVGGGSWGNMPWQDIAQESRRGTLDREPR